MNRDDSWKFDGPAVILDWIFILTYFEWMDSLFEQNLDLCSKFSSKATLFYFLLHICNFNADFITQRLKIHCLHNKLPYSHHYTSLCHFQSSTTPLKTPFKIASHEHQDKIQHNLIQHIFKKKLQNSFHIPAQHQKQSALLKHFQLNYHQLYMFHCNIQRNMSIPIYNSNNNTPSKNIYF